MFSQKVAYLLEQNLVARGSGRSLWGLGFLAPHLVYKLDKKEYDECDYEEIDYGLYKEAVIEGGCANIDGKAAEINAA